MSQYTEKGFCRRCLSRYAPIVIDTHLFISCLSNNDTTNIKSIISDESGDIIDDDDSNDDSARPEEGLGHFAKDNGTDEDIEKLRI